VRVSILACVLSAIAAICVYACVAHLLAARHPWFRKVHLTFAAVAALAAVHALSHIAVYASNDVIAYLAASTYSNASGALVMAILPWLVLGYFGSESRLMPSLLSALFVLSVCLNEFSAVGSAIRPLPVLEQIVLPWGELATIHRVHTTPVALVVFWIVATLLLAYVTLLAVRGKQRGNRQQTLVMATAIAILVLALAGNVLVLTNQLDSIFMGEFGFLGLVLIMMRLLSGEESYRAIVAQASAGIFVASASGRLLQVNGAARKMLARSGAELRKMSITELTDGTLPNALPSDDTDEASRGMHRLRRKDGSTVVADLSTQVLSDGRVLYIARDVTEKQRVDAAMQLLAQSGLANDSEQFFSRCAQSIAQAFDVRHAFIGTIDREHERMQSLAQWSRGNEDPGSYRLDTAPCAQFDSTRRSIHMLNSSERFPEHAPFVARGVNGYLGAAIVASTRDIIGVVEVWDERPFVAGAESHKLLEMFAHRIAAEFERAASEHALRQLTADLETRIADRTTQLAQANAELEAFAYSVSHDLRTPVRAVDAYTGLLREHLGESVDATGQKYFERITHAAHRMRDLIEGLLTLSRLSHQPLRFETVDLSALAQEAFEQLRERDRSRSVAFVCEPGLSAHADRTAASIVMANLIENAWKYSSLVKHAQIEFGRDRDDDSVFFVRDNGIGFDMTHAKHLFEPFRRLHTQADFPGTGIGLATVERIVKRHHGRIWAHSEHGRGATFYFTLNGLAQAHVTGAFESRRVAASGST
jgi:PAS domain S-box-containing protein